MLFQKRQRRINRILIVEDEPLVAFDNEHFLRGEGYEIVGTVDTVADARAAMALEPDLVLADVNLSGEGSGRDVAFDAHERGVPVIFVTGACPPDAQAHAIGILSKPYAQRDLLAAIEAVEAVLTGGTPKRIPASFRLFER